ncbi:MAG: hypothetical protein ACRCXD_06920 [Luteolibacter sp.]
MTPTPPSSSEEPALPRRSRPNLIDGLKESTEVDLWAFDDLDPTEDMEPKPQPPPISSGIPMPREGRKKVTLAVDDPPAPSGVPARKKGVRFDINHEVTKTPQASTVDRATLADDFHDLDGADDWEEGETPVLSIHPSFLDADDEAAEVEESAPEKVTPPPTKPVVEELDEFSPVVPENAKPISLVPHLQLSKVERIGLGALCLMLLVGAVVVFIHSIHRLPAGTERLTAGDFPVKGSHVTIQSADSFWRAPITEGKNAETFRRGTQLLPVIELTSSGNAGAIRVIFRDQDGRGAGDVLTQAIQPGVPIQIAATAGFEDVGMHAAYRAGQTEAWTVEVLEASSETAANSDFKKLFEIDISTDRR